ncbi:MAG: hypothetical protein HY860_04075 [Chlamydiales bacterium]|nr:hypothetical protein [Chlamydiales bacterium]
MSCYMGSCGGGNPFLQAGMHSGSHISPGGNPPSGTNSRFFSGLRCCAACQVAMNILKTLALLLSVGMLMVGVVTLNPTLIIVGAIGTAIFGSFFFSDCCCN